MGVEFAVLIMLFLLRGTFFDLGAVCPQKEWCSPRAQAFLAQHAQSLLWGKYIRWLLAPLESDLELLPLALVLTFSVSGLLHDLVIMAVRSEFVLLFTPWFSFHGIVVVVSEFFGWKFEKLSWSARAAVNLACVGMALMLSILLTARLGVGV